MLTINEIGRYNKEKENAAKKLKNYSRVIIAAGSIFLFPANLGSKVYDYFMRYNDGVTKRIISSTSPERYKKIFNDYLERTVIFDKDNKRIFFEINQNSDNPGVNILENRLGEKMEIIIENRSSFLYEIDSYLRQIDLKGVPEEVVIAVAAYESCWGRNRATGCNLFGVKDFTNKGKYLRTPEYMGDAKGYEMLHRPFKVYDNEIESINHFLNLRIVRESRDDNPYKMIDNMFRRNYASDPQWPENVKKTIKSLRKNDARRIIQSSSKSI